MCQAKTQYKINNHAKTKDSMTRQKPCVAFNGYEVEMLAQQALRYLKNIFTY